MADGNVSDLRRHQQVVATEDLPGVPTGTHGKVQLVNGFSWVRYRVRFDNGEELGFLNRDQLAPAKGWEGAA